MNGAYDHLNRRVRVSLRRRPIIYIDDLSPSSVHIQAYTARVFLPREYSYSRRATILIDRKIARVMPYPKGARGWEEASFISIGGTSRETLPSRFNDARIISRLRVVTARFSAELWPRRSRAGRKSRAVRRERRAAG